MKSARDIAEQALAWVDTRRSAMATIRWLERNGVEPRTLVDAGANNSQWMRRLARRWPKAAVLSFEPQTRCHPIGKWHAVGLGRAPATMKIVGEGTSARLVPCLDRKQADVVLCRLDEYEPEFVAPSVLKVDCEDHTYDALEGAGKALGRFCCVVVEIWEGLDAPCEGRNKHAEIHHLMFKHGFDRAMTVGAMPWRNHVSITDALFWKSSDEKEVH